MVIPLSSSLFESNNEHSKLMTLKKIKYVKIFSLPTYPKIPSRIFKSENENDIYFRFFVLKVSIPLSHLLCLLYKHSCPSISLYCLLKVVTFACLERKFILPVSSARVWVIYLLVLFFLIIIHLYSKRIVLRSLL